MTNLISSLFFPFVETKKKHQNLSKLVDLYREIFLSLVYSEWRSTSKECQIQ